MKQEKIIPHNSLQQMPPERKRSFSDIFTGIIIFITIGYLFFSIFRSAITPGIGIFNTVFISILMQAFPFMLIGILVSSAMHVFIPDEWIVKIFPTKYGLGFLTALFAGIFSQCVNVPSFQL